ncbi:MAG: hypothetical protein GY951_00765 [Psychromonas sp.]|nr:hypothetical protein [Psychromonas sp.]
MRQLGLLILLFSNLSYAQIPGLAPTKNWDLNGYVKYMGTTNLPDNDDNSLDHLIHQRFNYEYRFTPQLRINIGMRNRLIAGDSTEFPGYADLIKNDPGYFNLSFNWLDNNSLIGNTGFDRLYLDWSNQDWQARIGRSRINWAMSTLWNPNDIFNSYSIYDFDHEERAGSDAILVKRKLGFASSIELVYNPNQESELDSLATRYLFNYKAWDMQLIAGKSHLDYILGAGFAGDIQGAGLRAEMSWFNPSQNNWDNGEELLKLESSMVATLETDYSFISQRNWMVRASILYISKPQNQDSGIKFLNLPLTARTLSFSNSTYYADIGFDINPLSRLTFSGSYYDDGSYFVGLNNSYSLADNWQLQGVLQRFDGSNNSLFGQTPNLLAFVQLKWSF